MSGLKILFKNFLIFSAKEKDDFFPGSIVVEDGEIKQVIKKGDQPPIDNSFEIIEGTGKILMPGLVNSHTHIYSTFARGLSISPFSPTTFKELLEQLWWRLDKALTLEDVYYSGLISSADMIRNGVTTFIDHHASPNAVRGSLKQLTKSCVEEAGLRGIFCYETSDRDGKETAEKGIDENLEAARFSSKYPGKAASLFGLHASFTLSDDTLSRCSEAKLPIHVHVAEGEEDATLHKKEFGISAMSRLDKFELLRENSLLSHCLLIDDEDLDLIKSKNCRVVFNPQSNMNNGARIPNYSRFKNTGIKINLGNDGYGTDLTRDMRTLLLTQHLLHKDPTVFGTSDLFDIVFKNNAEYASHILKTKIGKIVEGYRADLVIYQYNPPTPLTAENFMDHYYFSIMENCKPKAVLVDGRWLMKEEELCTLDEEKVNSESRKQCDDFWKRV